MAKDFSLGTDPEAVLWVLKTKKIRRPHDIIEDRDPHSQLNPLGANAIGVDGNRDTSSVEFRPGVSSSGEELVNRLADLITLASTHYSPPGVIYRAGAYVEPEPLGGHMHLSWKKVERQHAEYNDTLWRVLEIVSGWHAMSEYLIPSLFSADEIALRKEYARRERRDFADGMSIRPNTMDKAMAESHLEYRYPPSWLMTPEAAFCFLGGAERIADEVFSLPLGRKVVWKDYVARMFTDRGYSPDHGASLPEAFGIAKKYTTTTNFAENWVA